MTGLFQYYTRCRRRHRISGADNCIYQKNLSNCHTRTKIGRHMHYSLLFHNRTLATRIFKMADAIPYNLDTVRHVMDKIRDAVRLLNPGQVPVITADQPIKICYSQADPVAVA